jgi:hypothetical protein
MSWQCLGGYGLRTISSTGASSPPAMLPIMFLILACVLACIRVCKPNGEGGAQVVPEQWGKIGPGA